MGATLALFGLGALAGSKAQAQGSLPAYWGGPLPKNMAMPVHSIQTVAPNESVSQRQAGTSVSVSQPFVITGVVYNAHGTPVSGVIVELGGTEVETSVTTDANGAFRFVVDKDSLGDYAALNVMRFAPLRLYYQYASAEIDLAGNQQYQLHLKNRLKRRVSSV